MMRKVILLAATALIAASSVAHAALLSDFGTVIMDQASGNPAGPDVGFNGQYTDPFQWQNHQAVEWSFAYDGTKMIFTFGNVVVTKVADLSKFKVVGMEGFTVNEGLPSLPQDLKLTVDISDVGGIDFVPVIAEFDQGVEHFSLFGARLEGTWSIKGTAVGDWTGPLGPNSPGDRFGFGIGVLLEPILEPVPEPAALGLFGLGLLGLGAARRRKRA